MPSVHLLPHVRGFLQPCFQDIVYSNCVAVKRKLPFLNSLYTSLFQYFITLIQCKSVFISWHRSMQILLYHKTKYLCTTKYFCMLEVCKMIVPMLVQKRQEICHNDKKPVPHWQQLLVAQATWCMSCHFQTEV